MEELRAWLRAVEPAALLVEPRILRRVIRLDRRLERLAFEVPHRKSYTIERERLLAFADPSEMGLPSLVDAERSTSIELPRTLILLSTPTDDESLSAVPVNQSIRRYWRLLFHARAHLMLERQLEKGIATDQYALQRRLEIGELEFAEIRSVLLKDEYLFPEPTDFETYVEFVAVYLELREFAEQNLAIYFPGVRDWQRIHDLVERDIDSKKLLEECRPPSEWLEADATPQVTAPLDADWSSGDLRDWWSGSAAPRQARARRAAALGNSVKAAILQVRANDAQGGSSQGPSFRFATDELRAMVLRLQPVLQLTPVEVEEWCLALHPLLLPAARGIWTNEARFLYDLQKVCVEHERGVFKLDLIEWVKSRGQIPVRRPLPLLREVLITKHLRAALRRLPTTRLDAAPRARLEELLEATVKRIERRSRDRIRPVVSEVFNQVGLIPDNIPEEIARANVVEELLDRIVEHGAVNLGNLRDAISKSDLKLPDLSGVGELVRGDRLLRADRQLGRVMEGVYRPGAIYLRWTQRLSSLAFGTNIGRFVTQYVALPFGGAWLAIDGLRHLIGMLTGHGESASLEFPEPQTAPVVPPSRSWIFYLLVTLLGTLITLLMHRPEFRAWCLKKVLAGWALVREILVDLPASLIRSPWVQKVLRSPIYSAIRYYILRPLILTYVVSLFLGIARRPPGWHALLDIYLGLALFLNSPIGRYADEWLGDYLVRAWHSVRIHVFAAAFQWVMEAFQRWMVALERVVYGVDEWLRFRAGDNRQMEAVKLLASTCWFFISYVVVFAFTLLIEPQINPIKHFPVVTVSHKLILPTGPHFVEQLEPWLGRPRAHTLVWSTIWLIPGVFGFLVWELNGNWQLYEANRAVYLPRSALGHHGETMIGLLRPGFHSGTVPKLFASLRRSVRKAERTRRWAQVRSRQMALHHVEATIGRFVERELLGLLKRLDADPWQDVRVERVRISTNRIEAALANTQWPAQSVWLTWEEHEGKLTAIVSRNAWVEKLDTDDVQQLSLALAGLFQRSGVQEVLGPLAIASPPSVTWEKWVSAIKPHRTAILSANHAVETHRT
uniref:Uncharacterized protein n=1 Tax=uncultured bacterium A1Q1_fos_962 TaxID=1256592 RepID=L7W0X1_9BACT|nr:hypothetical protein [uncultured bacterium A1Q1_fos_962]